MSRKEELEKDAKVWNYKTMQHTGEPKEYVKDNLEARYNKIDIPLNYGADLRKRGKRGQKHDRPDTEEGPKGAY